MQAQGRAGDHHRAIPLATVGAVVFGVGLVLGDHHHAVPLPIVGAVVFGVGPVLGAADDRPNG